MSKPRSVGSWPQRWPPACLSAQQGFKAKARAERRVRGGGREPGSRERRAPFARGVAAIVGRAQRLGQRLHPQVHAARLRARVVDGVHVNRQPAGHQGRARRRAELVDVVPVQDDALGRQLEEVRRRRLGVVVLGIERGIQRSGLKRGIESAEGQGTDLNIVMAVVVCLSSPAARAGCHSGWSSGAGCAPAAGPGPRRGGGRAVGVGRGAKGAAADEGTHQHEEDVRRAGGRRCAQRLQHEGQHAY